MTLLVLFFIQLLRSACFRMTKALHKFILFYFKLFHKNLVSVTENSSVLATPSSSNDDSSALATPSTSNDTSSGCRNVGMTMRKSLTTSQGINISNCSNSNVYVTIYK